MEKDPATSYQAHAFICTAVKEGRESCGAKGSAELRDRLKKWVKGSSLEGRVKITASLCLGHCERGISVVIYPAGQWYFQVNKDSDFELIQNEILKILESPLPS